jgi:hypothetical protein
MSTRPNFERLRDAFAILDGLPEEAIKLWTWREKGRKPECGTIACAAGWLAMHPAMNALGLTTLNQYDGTPKLAESYSGMTAMRVFFDLSMDEATIFEGRRHGYKDWELHGGGVLHLLTDKQLWKRRALRLFQKYNEPFDPKVAEGLMLDARQS